MIYFFEILSLHNWTQKQCVVISSMVKVFRFISLHQRHPKHNILLENIKQEVRRN